MKNYILVSGVLFAAIALAHVLRLLYQWPMQVDQLEIPHWPSAIAIVVTGGLAIWAFRLAKG